VDPLVRLQSYLEWLIAHPVAELNRAQRFLRFAVDLVRHCSRELRDNDAAEMAAALTYRTIFGLVPLLMVSMLAFRLFGDMEHAARRLRQLIAKLSKARDLLQLGAYQSGADTELDLAVRLAPQIQAFLQQDMHERAPLDTSRAHLLALESLLNGGGNSTYNLGNSSGYSVRQVIEAAREITGHPIPIRAAERRAGDPAVLIADSSRIRNELGWKPRYERLEDIIRTAWSWHRKEAGLKM